MAELLDAMNRAVLEGCGWTDVLPFGEFIPEQEDESDVEESVSASSTDGGLLDT